MIIAIILLIAIGIYAFLQTAVFGQNPEGADFERIQKSAHYKNGKFENESFTPDLQEGVSYFDMLKEFFKTVKDKEPSVPLPSVKTDLNTLQAPKSTASADSDLQSESNPEPLIVWFGHSSYLLRTNDKNILVDPVLSGYASPIPVGTAAYKTTYTYTVADMPDIDVLVISHDHYDHLDYETVKALRPRVKHVITSLGVGSHLKRWGYAPEQITELDWNDSKAIDSLMFTAQPARHFSGRGFKRHQTFWSSFVLKTPTHNFYLGGDSGYDAHFKRIGEKYGPFDLAILECGQYNEYWKYIHMMPEEVALAATELKAKVLMPVHWGKFTLAPHAWYEPIERVTTKAEELGVPILTPMIGEVSPVKSPLPATSDRPSGGMNTKKWWNL